MLVEGIKSEEKRSKLLAEDGHQSVLSFTLAWKTFFIAPNIERPRKPRMLTSCKPFRGSKWSFKTVYNLWETHRMIPSNDTNDLIIDLLGGVIVCSMSN